MPSDAFSGCRSLTDVDISGAAALTRIGRGAFMDCGSLTYVTLPAALTSIGDWAFAGCTSLALTSLPDGLTSIGEFAFCDCASLALTSLPVRGGEARGEGKFLPKKSRASIRNRW